LAATGCSARLGQQARTVRGVLPIMPAEHVEDLQGATDVILRQSPPDGFDDYLAGLWRRDEAGPVRMIELLGRVGERDQAKAFAMRRALASRIPAADRSLLFAGDLIRALSREEFEARENYFVKGFVQALKTAAVAKKRADRTRSMTGTSRTVLPVTRQPSVAESTKPPFSIGVRWRVPAYRAPDFRHRRNLDAWEDFYAAILSIPSVSRNEQHAFMMIFAAEGGLISDTSRGPGTESELMAGEAGRAFDMDTVAGITQVQLDALVGGGKLPGVRLSTASAELIVSQRTRFYRAYFDDALEKVGGSQMLRRIPGSCASAGFADTLFRHGRPSGTRVIQRAINRLLPEGDRVLVDKRMGPKTINAFIALSADSKTDVALRNALANERRRAFANSPHKLGEFKRFDYFRTCPLS
jgi:hypothetical protein